MTQYIERKALLEKCGWYNTVDGKNLCVVRKDELASIPAADVSPVVHGRMRIEITTDDFRDIERARAEGCYRKHYFCPNCGIEIGHKTFDRKRQFGQGTILHSNKFPNYCPNCGARMDGE